MPPSWFSCDVPWRPRWGDSRADGNIAPVPGAVNTKQPGLWTLSGTTVPCFAERIGPVPDLACGAGNPDPRRESDGSGPLESLPRGTPRSGCGATLSPAPGLGTPRAEGLARSRGIARLHRGGRSGDRRACRVSQITRLRLYVISICVKEIPKDRLIIALTKALELYKTCIVPWG